MDAFILTLSYARNAEGKLDPEEGSLITSYPVPEELRQPHHRTGGPVAARLTREQTAMLLGVLNQLTMTFAAQEEAA